MVRPCVTGISGSRGCKPFPVCGNFLALAHDQSEQEHGKHKTDPDRRFGLQPEPDGQLAADADKGQIDVGSADQPDEQAVATRRFERQEALAHDGRRSDLPDRHAGEHECDADEKHGVFTAAITPANSNTPSSVFFIFRLPPCNTDYPPIKNEDLSLKGHRVPLVYLALSNKYSHSDEVNKS